MVRAAKSTAENVLLNFDSFKKLKKVCDKIIIKLSIMILILVNSEFDFFFFIEAV